MYTNLMQKPDYLSATLPYAHVERQPGKVGTMLGSWLQQATHRWKQRKTIVALSALDDTILRDIGIHRSQIPMVVAELGRGELTVSAVARSVTGSRDPEYGRAWAA